MGTRTQDETNNKNNANIVNVDLIVRGCATRELFNPLRRSEWFFIVFCYHYAEANSYTYGSNNIIHQTIFAVVIDEVEWQSQVAEPSRE
jgi:hypothetical protein